MKITPPRGFLANQEHLNKNSEPPAREAGYLLQDQLKFDLVSVDTLEHEILRMQRVVTRAERAVDNYRGIHDTSVDTIRELKGYLQIAAQHLRKTRESTELYTELLYKGLI